MQEHNLIARRSITRAHAVLRRVVKPVTESRSNELPVAHHRMLRACHMMDNVVEPCCKRFARTRSVESMPAAGCGGSQDRALEQALRVDDCIVALASERAPVVGNFPPRRRTQQFLSPAA